MEMVKRIKNLYTSVLLSGIAASSLSLTADTQFGYVSYMTTNVGDDIQAIAAQRLLPEGSIPIDRELIALFESDSTVHTLMNGWYMHTKDLGWYRPDMDPPEKSWPPADSIDPLLISMYFWSPFATLAFSEEGIEYLKKHGPVGARDYGTLKQLQAHGIPSYFSGCLTLTLDNPYHDAREDVIYAVDLSQASLAHLKKIARCKVVEVPHGITRELFFENDHANRLNYANGILDKYRRAKCVVTHRLHAAMPCLAFQTPVLFSRP